MTLFRIKTALVLAASLICSGTYAYTIDMDTFFAYGESKQKSMSYFYILLSHAPCQAKGAPKEAKFASFAYPIHANYTREVPACWYIERYAPQQGGDSVVVCSTPDNTMPPGDAGCVFERPNRFMDTSTLPRAANLGGAQ